MNVLMIINGSAYGLDATYNAVRLAASMAKRDDLEVTVFLMGDGVTTAIAGQKTPDGYYKLDRMLVPVLRGGGQILCCGTCMDARGITTRCSSRAPAAPPWTRSPMPHWPRTRCWSSDVQPGADRPGTRQGSDAWPQRTGPADG